MDDDIAAILSESDYPVDDWESADFHYQADGSVIVEVEMEDGEIEVFVLPDHDAADQVWEYCEENEVEHDSNYEG